jgi:hypothetical protein
MKLQRRVLRKVYFYGYDLSLSLALEELAGTWRLPLCIDPEHKMSDLATVLLQVYLHGQGLTLSLGTEEPVETYILPLCAASVDRLFSQASMQN